MSALVWKQAAKVWWSAFRDCQALLAMCRAELDAADRRVSEALDERDVAVAAHRQLCADFNRQRDQLRALQSELAQRASRDADLDWAIRDAADARLRSAKERLRAARHELEAATWEEDEARQDATAAHRMVMGAEQKGVAA